MPQRYRPNNCSDVPANLRDAVAEAILRFGPYRVGKALALHPGTGLTIAVGLPIMPGTLALLERNIGNLDALSA